MQNVGFRGGLAFGLAVMFWGGGPAAGQSLTQTVTLATPVGARPYRWEGPVTVTAAGGLTGQGRYAPGGPVPATINLPLTTAGRAALWTGSVTFTRTGLLTGTGRYGSGTAAAPVTQAVAIPVTMDGQPYTWEGPVTVTAAGQLTGTGQLRPLGPGTLALTVPVGTGTWAGRLTFTPDGRVTGAGTLTGVRFPAVPASLRIAWLSMSPASVVGGQPAAVSIVLNQVTPVDLRLPVTSSAPALVAVPAVVLIPAGKSGLVVPLTTSHPAALTTVVIRATYAGLSPEASLLLRP